MNRTVKVINDFEDSDRDWEFGHCNGKHEIPRSTLTGKIALREVAQGNIVEVNFDGGDHKETMAYLQAMCNEYDLTLHQGPCSWIISPRPTVSVEAVSQ